MLLLYESSLVLNPGFFPIKACMHLCYMCDSAADSMEHVPPKCLFPHDSDLPLGAASLRKSLITVPSCAAHNMSKSKEDEFLLYALSLNVVNNGVALVQYLTKIQRAIKRKPALYTGIAKDGSSVIAVDGRGCAMTALRVNIDNRRLHNAFKCIAHGIYFYHYKKCFIGDVRLIHDMVTQVDQKISWYVDVGGVSIKMNEWLKTSFEKLQHFGENQDVFRYAFDESDANGILSLRLQFYGNSNVYVSFLAHSNAEISAPSP